MIVALDMPLSLQQIAHAIGAAPIHPSAVIRRICTDSREALPGDLFFALDGQHARGADFVTDARSRGAFAVSTQVGEGVLCVRDTVAALASLAAEYRSHLPSLKKTVAVTGSVGKTTTKNMLIALLSDDFATHGTHGNYNNQIGVPLTLLSAPRSTEMLVAEIGISHPGEMQPLSELVHPDVALITNVGHAHVGNFGSEEQLFSEKSRIACGLKENGTLLVPYGDPRCRAIKGAEGVSLQDPHAPFYLSCRQTADEEHHAVFFYKGRSVCELRLPFSQHGVLEDCAMAISAALTCGASPVRFENAFRLVRGNGLRMRSLTSPHGIHILDDAYNASPESMKEALDTLCRRTKAHRCVLLGDMLELGGDTEHFHRMIGRQLYACGIEKAFFFGVYAPFYRLGAQEAGMSPSSLFVNNDITSPELTVRQIRDACHDGDTLLCKASHGSHLQAIIQELIV